MLLLIASKCRKTILKGDTDQKILIYYDSVKQSLAIANVCGYMLENISFLKKKI